MNKLRLFLLILLSTFISTSSSAWDSKCKVEVEIQIQNTANPDYINCLDDRIEDSPGKFIVHRSHTFRNISEDVCKNDITDMLLDQKIEVPFSDQFYFLGLEPFEFKCSGKIISVKEIKYKSQKGFIYN